MSFKPVDRRLLPPDTAKLPRTAKRLADLLLKGSSSPPSQNSKEWSLDFLLSPQCFKGSIESPKVLSSIQFRRTILQDLGMFEPGAQVLPSEGTTALEASLAFRSIGYKSEPITGMKDLGIDFDSIRGIIPNDSHGRIISLSTDGNAIPGMYCSGWVKRGPAGVIANTMEDAFGTAEAITRDWEAEKLFMAGGNGWDALKEEARRRGLRPVNWSDWQKIDAAEKERGRIKGKEREKISNVQEMLSILD